MSMKWQGQLKISIYILLIGSLLACGSQKEITESQRLGLERAVTTPTFKIQMQWAYPLSNTASQYLNNLQPGVRANGNRIYIADGSNYVQIKNDSVFVDLPYFGTRQISGGMPGNVGVQIKEALKDWELRPEKKANQRSIRIATKHKGEYYDLSIHLFAEGKATLVVSTSQRQSIRYEGRWSEGLED